LQDAASANEAIDPGRVLMPAHRSQLSQQLRNSRRKGKRAARKTRTEITKQWGTGPTNENSLFQVLDESVSIDKVDVTPIPEKGEIEPLARSYVKWIKSGNSFTPAGNVTTEANLQCCAYEVGVGMQGPVFTKIKPKTDGLYRFEGSVTEEVLKEIDKFWGLSEDYKRLEALHNRGILLEGPPGMGKSVTIAQVTEMVAGRGDVVFHARSIHALIPCLKAFREVEPDRKVLVVLEDADEYANYQQREFLQLFDGADAIDGVCFLATTNYLDRFPPRMIRPGRFDKIVHIGPPPMEGRLAYLKAKLKNVNEADDDAIEKLAQETDGMSFGHLRELVLAVYALKEPVDEVLARLKNKPVSECLTESEAAPFFVDGGIDEAKADEMTTSATTGGFFADMLGGKRKRVKIDGKPGKVKGKGLGLRIFAENKADESLRQMNHKPRGFRPRRPRSRLRSMMEAGDGYMQPGPDRVKLAKAGCNLKAGKYRTGSEVEPADHIYGADTIRIMRGKEEIGKLLFMPGGYGDMGDWQYRVNRGGGKIQFKSDTRLYDSGPIKTPLEALRQFASQVESFLAETADPFVSPPQ
jgi:hypothetical protein